jgi:hypothetical protein
MNIGTVITAAVAGAARPPDPPEIAAAAGRAAGATGASAPPTAPRGAMSAALGDAVRGLSVSAGQRHAEQLGGLLSGFVRSALSPASAAAGATGSLAFLKDPRLSVEEKLARLMVQLSDKYERQLEEKLRQFADLEGGKATPTSSSTKKSSGGALGALGDGLAKLLGKAGSGSSALGGALLPKLVGQLSGPVLAGAATVLGMPAIAPALLKAGPLIGGFATQAVSSLTGRPVTPAKSGSTSAASGSSSTPAPSEKQLMTEIQILQEKQREMFTLVSNILRSLHDTKMAVIGNIR